MYIPVCDKHTMKILQGRDKLTYVKLGDIFAEFFATAQMRKELSCGCTATCLNEHANKLTEIANVELQNLCEK